MVMIKRFDLRKRIVAGLIIYTCLLTIAVGVNGYIVNEKIEELVWEELLDLETTHFYKKEGLINDDLEGKESRLVWYNEGKGDVIPSIFNQLGEGIHDEIKYLDKEYIIKVIKENNNKYILALDITEIEKHEETMLVSTILLTIFAVLFVAYITYRQMDKFIGPLLALAEQLKTISPEKDVISVEGLDDRFYEYSVINAALNDYLNKSHQYIKQEKIFFETVSHELRTPISVISGAIEHLLDHPDTTTRIKPHVQRISRITAEMEELLAMLLVLARSKEKLNQYSVHIDLCKEIPSIIEYHKHLCIDKQLSVRNEIQTAFIVYAPLQLLRVTIGNLLRNAIEHSDKGIIRIYQEGSSIIIHDPGHGMTAEEISQLYRERVRAGTSSINGIGVELILKICQHYGWRLEFESEKTKGTKAILKLDASRVSIE